MEAVSKRRKRKCKECGGTGSVPDLEGSRRQGIGIGSGWATPILNKPCPLCQAARERKAKKGGKR